MSLRLILVCGVILIFMSSACDEEVTEPEPDPPQPAGPALPQRGEWSSTTEFGELWFGVNDLRNAINQLYFVFDSWQCGALILDGPVHIIYEEEGEKPISEGSFAILQPVTDHFVMAINGSFSAIDSMSGTWSGTGGGTTCSGDWRARPAHADADYCPIFGIFVSEDFTRTEGVIGFGWHPGSQVTLEIDNGPDGIIDFERTVTANDWGGAFFRDYGGVAPFTVEEGDSVRLYDGETVIGCAVVYVTLESVDTANDIVSGFARVGTIVDVRVFYPSDPNSTNAEQVAEADSEGVWTANFQEVIDLIPGCKGWVGAGGTQIDW